MFGPKHRLMNQAGGEGAPGGGGPLFGGGGEPPAGGTPPTTPPAGGTPPAAPTIPENWKEAIPEDLRAMPFMEKYKGVADLAKGYANLEKVLGSEKMPIPQKGTKLADMKDVFEKIGLPKSKDEYALGEYDPSKVDKAFLDAFKDTAYDLNMLPDQAKGLVDWFVQVNEKAQKEQADASVAAANSALEKYKNDLGEAYNDEIAKAKAALRTLDKEDQEFIQKSGLGVSVPVIKLLAKYGSTLGEGAIRGEGGRLDGAMSPEAAHIRIAEIKANVNGAYYDEKHVDHAKMKAEVTRLYSYAYPETKK